MNLELRRRGLQEARVFLSPGVNRPGRETDRSPHLVPRSRTVKVYLHTPILLNGLVLY
jgi:hypothetical protein